jgi:CDP-glucose 4,6-dehydratase
LTIMDKKSLEPIVLNEASNEIVNQYLDCSKAQKMLGWQPRYSREDGLQQTIRWYERHMTKNKASTGSTGV